MPRHMPARLRTWLYLCELRELVLLHRCAFGARRKRKRVQGRRILEWNVRVNVLVGHISSQANRFAGLDIVTNRARAHAMAEHVAGRAEVTSVAGRDENPANAQLAKSAQMATVARAICQGLLPRLAFTEGSGWAFSPCAGWAFSPCSSLSTSCNRSRN